MFDHVAQVAVPSILGRRTQVGMVVRDIEAATTFWSTELGVGPWIIIESSGADRRFVHRGSVTPVEMVIAFSYTGETQLEIICQTNDAPSLYHEFLDEGREGFHHLGFWPEDVEASGKALERAGFKELSTLYLPDGTRNVTYYESPRYVGAFVEIAPMTLFRKTYMDAIENLASAWDGSRPLRRFSSREEFIASDDFSSASSRRSSAL